MNKTIRVRMEAIPTDKLIEKGHGKGQTGLDVILNAMHDLCEMANGGEYGKHGFDEHAFIMIDKRKQKADFVKTSIGIPRNKDHLSITRNTILPRVCPFIACS